MHNNDDPTVARDDAQEEPQTDQFSRSAYILELAASLIKIRGWHQHDNRGLCQAVDPTGQTLCARTAIAAAGGRAPHDLSGDALVAAQKLAEWLGASCPDYATTIRFLDGDWNDNPAQTAENVMVEMGRAGEAFRDAAQKAAPEAAAAAGREPAVRGDAVELEDPGREALAEAVHTHGRRLNRCTRLLRRLFPWPPTNH
jgi:hypothetical protein